jgi:hypothetical protein
VVGRDDDGKRTEATMKKIRGKENVVRSNDEGKRVMRAALKKTKVLPTIQRPTME